MDKHILCRTASALSLLYSPAFTGLLPSPAPGGGRDAYITHLLSSKRIVRFHPVCSGLRAAQLLNIFSSIQHLFRDVPPTDTLHLELYYLRLRRPCLWPLLLLGDQLRGLLALFTGA